MPTAARGRALYLIASSTLSDRIKHPI
jgi:hypothetical protein